MTGRISGRLEVCLLMYRFRSTRIFSLMTPQSDFSSALDSSTVFIMTSRAPAINSWPLSLMSPRVTISGCDSILPVCLSIAMIGTTMPSSERCLRSRITTSSISSSEPESTQTRPAVTGSRRCAPSSVNSIGLPSAGQNNDALRIESADVLRPHHHSVGNAQQFERVRNLHVVDHAAPDERDFPVHARSDVDDLLNAMNGRSEAGQNYAPRRGAAQFFDSRNDGPLRRRKAGAFHVCRIAEQRQH